MCNSQFDYEAACKRAATDQGLDPVIALLDADGITHGIEQTGGFCMVVTVQVPDGIIGITRDDEGDDVCVLLAFYPGTTWYDGLEDEDDAVVNTLPIDEMIGYLFGYGIA